MVQLNLCIDIDGTITEAYDWIPRANQYFNANIKPTDVTVYEIHKALGVESEAYEEFYHEYGEVLHEEVSIRKGAKEAINKLYKDHQIHIVTAREDKMRDITLSWFAGNQVPYHNLFLLGSHYKVAKAMELSCDLFLEDRLENALQLAAAGFNVLLMDCHYNQGPLPAGISRVKNWFEVYDYIRSLEADRSKYRIAT
ncbi:5' nucleotidase, NT5C type [Alkaliphilus hydrothermalis]|uniref:Nucleotidase n=1 Tax=Alkaliphilus hydrothermalis TaxID=1482730 RepID=A0ABS2NSZ7_9FIRM|nr:hypothetical protein [Alkaliphilus hydrothermalis]MBM7616084.1 putative HAD superfamily protein [Alkaliphilus hydrothermalis]